MTEDLEKRIAALEAWRESVEPHVLRMLPLGPNKEQYRQFEKQQKEAIQQIADRAKAKPVPPVDRSAQQLVSGKPVPEDHSHTQLKADGQQQDYVVLSREERAKGFIRPVRTSYRHVGPLGPQNPLRDLTDDEQRRYRDVGYVKFEQYPVGSRSIGRFWMQSQLDAAGKGCGTTTTMEQSLAETYARDPRFYGGTFCCGCRRHFPVEEFVWSGSNERVGS